MKKYNKLILFTSICLISVGIVLTAVGFITGAWPRQIIENGLWNHTFSTKTYDNHYEESGSYTVDEKIDSLDIDWLAGKVSIELYDGEKVTLTESCREEDITSASSLGYEVKGSTLKISDSRSKSDIVFSITPDVEKPAKDLVIKVPKKMVHNGFEEINFDSASADLMMGGWAVKELTADTASGSVLGEFGSVSFFKYSSVSGGVDCLVTDIGTLYFSSTSGDCSLTVRHNDPHCSIAFDTISGKFHSDFKSKINGDNEIVLGNGAASYVVETTSGDLTISHH